MIKTNDTAATATSDTFKSAPSASSSAIFLPLCFCWHAFSAKTCSLWYVCVYSKLKYCNFCNEKENDWCYNSYD